MRLRAWHRDQNGLVGELAQWEIWVQLTMRSQGRLHVFEPRWIGTGDLVPAWLQSWNLSSGVEAKVGLNRLG